MMNSGNQQISIGYQSGQTMVFALVFIVVILIGVIILFNTGQLTRNKMEVQNAADAAAYSAAILTARELNFMAYTNRAMVANQVTLGQFAAFESWGQKYKLGSQGLTLGYLQLFIALLPVTAWDGGTTYNVISKALQFTLRGFNFINNFTSKVAMEPLSRVANIYIPAMQALYIGHQKALTIGTLASQWEMLPKVIDDNAKGAKFSNFGALAVFLSSQEQNLISSKKDKIRFLKKNSDKEGKRRFAAFVNDSRDGWTKNRQRQLGLPLGGSLGLGFGVLETKGFIGFGEIHGGTELRFLGKKETYGWSSLDSVEGEFTFGAKLKFYEICLPKWLGGACFTPPSIGFPRMGINHLDFAGSATERIKGKSGSERLSRNIPKWKKAPYGETWNKTPFAAKSAITTGYQGIKKNDPDIPDYFDINPDKYGAVDSAPIFIVGVRKNGDLLRTSDELDMFNKNKNAEQLAVTTKLAGGRDGFGETVEGDPANILRNKINKMVEEFRQNLLSKAKLPGGIGQVAIENIVKQFEKTLKNKVDELQTILNDAIPNTAAKKGGVFALAAAEVYFKNPDDSANAVHASTYSPYWQVRLTPVNDDIRRWSVISQGLLLNSPKPALADNQHLQKLSVMAE